jgi:polyphosphate kinase
MYRGYAVLAHAAFRVTRNSNLYFEEEEARSLLETIRFELHNRRKGDAVRLEIEAGADAEIVERLRVNFELDPDQVFRGDGPVNLSRLMFLSSDVARPDLKFVPFTPKPLHISRHSAPSSLRLVRSCCRIHRAGREGPRRADHEADALPHQQRLANVSVAD